MFDRITWVISIASKFKDIKDIGDSYKKGEKRVNKKIKERKMKIEINKKKIKMISESNTNKYEIVTIECDDHFATILAQKEWIKKFYPGYVMVMQSLEKIWENKKKYFDRILIENKAWSTKNIYFNMNKFLENESEAVAREIEKIYGTIVETV